MPRRPCSVLPVLLFLAGLGLFSIRVALGQTGKGEIRGEVRDPAGSMVPAARVVVTETRTNQVFELRTSQVGTFIIPNLKPGSYRMEVESSGFKRFVREGIQLATGEKLRLDVSLVVGDLSESVNVTADAGLLRTETGSLGQVVSNQKVSDLPLNGRSFVPLVALVAGVANPPGSALPRINGGRPRANEYLFDGISVLQPEPGQVAFFPVIDSIQEFKVESNSPPAEFGRFYGGVINLTYKSGTNQFHGSVFEFFRNEVLNARNLFAPQTATDSMKPRFRRNQFGFVLGGPLVKEKTFFFVDYQGTRQQIGRVRISTIPTLLQRQGDFTEGVGGKVAKIYDPATTKPKPGGGFTRTPFTGNRIPEGRIDPVARTLLNRYPLPTSSGTANNYRLVGNEGFGQDQFDVRLDHQFSRRDFLFGRYSYARDVTDPVPPLPDGSGNIGTGAIGLTKNVAQSFASGYTHTFNVDLINEVRLGYTRRSLNREGLSLDAPPSDSLNLPGIPTNGAFQNELPTFLVDGFQQLGPSANTASLFRTDVTQLVDAVTILRGRHSIKTGLDFRWERLDIVQPPSPTGSFRFSTLFTNLPGVTGTGSSLASFLLGQVQTFSIDLQQNVLRPRAMIQEYFVQDDWKRTGKLTVNAGLRSTLNFPSTEVNNQGAVFNLQTQKLEYLGQNGFPRSARELHLLNFGPRLGFAYRLTEKTVIRSGYGVIWIEQAGITSPFTNPQFPFIQSVSQRTLDNVNPAFVLAGGPHLAPIPPTPDAGLGQGVFSVDRQLGSGYAQQWNLAIQREISSNLSFEIAYAGNKITHVGIPDTNVNQLTVAQLASGTNLLQKVPNPLYGEIPPSSSLGDPTIPRAQLLKPYPRFTTVSFYRNNVGNTNYHALLVKLEKRMSRDLSFLVCYTRSKLIDEASSVFDAALLAGPVATSPVANSFNRKLERDVSTGDIPNVLVASVIYDLPFGPDHGRNASGWVGKLAGGWELAGIVTSQSGIPLAVTQATNFNAFAGFGTQRPNRIADPELPKSQRSTARYFDINAFVVAPQFTLGTSSRNPVRGPGFQDLDLALIKRTPIREQMILEFRAEVFNLTNTPPLNGPNAVLGTPGFGSITSAGDPRVMQFALKLNF